MWFNDFKSAFPSVLFLFFLFILFLQVCLVLVVAAVVCHWCYLARFYALRRNAKGLILVRTEKQHFKYFSC
ncbi:hypothetical protein HanPSC8_Chr15g0657541 [Helianthus annuus]|nr:hypothetical protein HanPSC8_Chr15g0657541 [Helianthus annuus]